MRTNFVTETTTTTVIPSAVVSAFPKLSNLEQMLVMHMLRVGYITTADALRAFGVAGGTLTKAISRIRQRGVKINKVQKVDPITGVRYTRYSIGA